MQCKKKKCRTGLRSFEMWAIVFFIFGAGFVCGHYFDLSSVEYQQEEQK